MIPHSALSKCVKAVYVQLPLMVSLICVVLAGFVCFLPDVFSAQVTLSWDSPSTNTDGTPLTDLSGYKVYYGTTTRSYTQTIDVGNTNTYTVSNLSDGTYYFAVTASNMSGNESVYSNEVNKTIQSTPQIYTINASAGTGGSISPSGSVIVNQSANQNFTITPDPGYIIADVKVDSASVGAVTSYTFSNVSAAHTIQAFFSTVSYTITASAGTGGSISPSGSVSVNQGASKTFSISANAGYSIADVKVDSTSVGKVASYTFSNVTAAHTIQASFSSSLSYTITASAGTGGSISPAGSVSIKQGASKTFTVAPRIGYRITDVRVDNISVGSVSSYTFSNVTAAHTIRASFSRK
jgi:Divergent InlB B-repeat domain